MFKNALSFWSLTAKLSVSAVMLCVLCVLATSAVVGLQATDQAEATAGALAEKAALSTAAQVGGELGNSFAAVLALDATMEGMRVADHAPSRDQLDDMAGQLLSQREEFIGTYSIWEPNALDGNDQQFVNQGPAYDATGRYIAYRNRGSGSIPVEALLDYEKAGATVGTTSPSHTQAGADGALCVSGG